jgi:hypothetical protein
MSQIDVQEVTSRKTEESFPNLLVLHPNNTVPVIVRTLEPGDMQLIVEFKGTRKCVAHISPSALNINKLLRTLGSIEYVISKNVSMPITSIEDYLSYLR